MGMVSPWASQVMKKRIATVLEAGLFCACAATLISSALWVLLFAVPSHFFDHAYQIPPYIAVICLYTFIPAGGFGFLCGVLGSLILRARHIASRVRLLAESAVIGTLLSTLFPLFLLVVRWGPVGDWLDGKAVLFCVAVGCPVSILYAAIFRKSLLVATPAPSGRTAD